MLRKEQSKELPRTPNSRLLLNDTSANHMSGRTNFSVKQSVSKNLSLSRQSLFGGRKSQKKMIKQKFNTLLINNNSQI